MWAEGRRYGGRTAEERRESRRTALLDAGYDLYGTLGYRNVSIERVCSHARLTARSFDEEFGSREALLRAVYDRTIAHAAEAVFSAMAAAGDGVRDVAGAGIAAFVHAMLDDPRAARIVHLEVVGVSEGMEGHRRQVLRAFADIVAAEGLRLNDEQQRYVDTNRNGEAMHVEGGGTLSLRATRTRTGDSWATYESAMIRSKATFRPTASTSYYITARVRMPDVVGTWPALWLNSDRRPDGSTTWPPEIDILEGAYNGRDDRADMLHQATIIRGAQTPSGGREYTFSAPEFDRTWNNYHAPESLRARWIEVSAEWTASNVCYLVDGYRTACENYRWVENGGQQAAPAHLLLNLAIGGSWAGRYGIDAAKFPTSLDVDWVRVYRRG